MNTNLLLPSNWKWLGWVLFLPSFSIGLMMMFGDFTLDFVQVESKSLFDNYDLTDELVGSLLILSLVLIGFTKLKYEDEYIYRIRLDSFQLAFYLHALTVAVALLTVYDDLFFDFMVLNLFIPLLLYVLIFHVKILLLKRSINE